MYPVRGREGGQETITKFAAVSTRRPPVRISKDPHQPTEQEIKEHNVTHLPHRSWCPVCVKARGREDMHRKVLDKGDKPIVSMDYKAFGESKSIGGKGCRKMMGCRQDS